MLTDRHTRLSDNLAVEQRRGSFHWSEPLQSGEVDRNSATSRARHNAPSQTRRYDALILVCGMGDVEGASGEAEQGDRAEATGIGAEEGATAHRENLRETWRVALLRHRAAGLRERSTRRRSNGSVTPRLVAEARAASAVSRTLDPSGEERQPPIGRRVPGNLSSAATDVPRSHRRQHYARLATSSISTAAPSGNPATATVVRAGNGCVNRRPYAAFIAAKSRMSVRYTLHLMT